jgi:hypothetical protein
MTTFSAIYPNTAEGRIVCGAIDHAHAASVPTSDAAAHGAKQQAPLRHLLPHTRD